MPTPSQLFGLIAIQLGYATREQVDAALAAQEQLLARGLSEPVGQILMDKGIVTTKQVEEIVLRQYTEGRNHSSDYARVVVENGFATKEQVEQAMEEQRRAYAERGEVTLLGALFLRKGILNTQKHRSVLRALGRLKGRKKDVIRDTRMLYGVSECPVCLELTRFGSESCDGCGAFLGKLELKPLCPRCRTVQDPQSTFCAKCGVNLETGDAPTVKPPERCRFCAGPMAPGQPRCFGCGNFVPAAWPLRIVQAAGRLFAGAVRSTLGFVAVLIIPAALLGVWLYQGQIKSTALSTLKGQPSAELTAALDGLLRAMTYKDYRGIARAAGGASGAGGADAEAARGTELFSRLLGLAAGAGEVEISSTHVEDAPIAGEEATAYVEIELRVRKAAAGAGAGSGGEGGAPAGSIDAIAKNLERMSSGGGDSGKRHLTWYWRRRDGRWTLDLR
ncbi:MAG: zinc ribbon domain-containing protein [Planctomycetes bacterium]|nr:zinc ribbon domain-containing protein [Planctomycetota bacterium]